MTSQRMSEKQLNEFKNYFRRFIFGQSNSYEALDSINSIPNIQKRITQRGLIETRKQHNLTTKQQMKINAYKFTELFKLSKQAKDPQIAWRNPECMFQIYGFGLNQGAFLPTIQYLGNKQQVQNWKNLILNGKVIGGYGQTQLGHGSNVQMLETQALYNQTTGTFFINTPRNTATKFWPGCFGIYATHCVLQAKTIVKGKSIGIQTFIVPLRDQYLSLYPGVESGDIGPKIGFSKVDNGYVKFNNFQIPRQNMLSRYVQVEADGSVNGLENKQAIKYAYGSMLNLRVQLVVSFAVHFKYLPAVVQLEINQNYQRVVDPIFKKRCVQVLSTAIGTLLSNMYVSKTFKQFLLNLQNKNYQKADKLLIVCHIMSSTFKALVSWRSQQISRQFITLNQFGTFQSSFLPKFYTDCIPSVTYEGDNTVLIQQTAKFILMKQKDTELIKPKQQIDSNNLNDVLTMFRYINSSQIRKLKDLIQKAVESGKDFNEVWNQIYQSKILQVSKLWGNMTFIFTITETLKIIKNYNHFFQTVAKVFVSILIKQTKQIAFYGFKISQSTAWKQFSQDQFNVLRNLNLPIYKQSEPYNYETRGNKDVQDWMYARL